MDSTLERDFWRNDLRLQFKEIGHASRIESHATATGIPDVDFQLKDGPEWWFELKATANGIIEIRPAQARWINQRISLGGKVRLFVKDIRENRTFYWLFKGAIAGKHKIDDLREEIDFIFFEGKINWNIFEMRMRNGTA